MSIFRYHVNKERMLNREAEPRDSTWVLKAEPGKFDIKARLTRKPSILIGSSGNYVLIIDFCAVR